MERLKIAIFVKIFGSKVGKLFRKKNCLQICDVTLLSRNTADRFVGMAQRSRKIFGSKVGKNFWKKKCLQISLM